MRTALYYPHSEVGSESLLRSALLTWDQLEFIVPYKGYQPQHGSRDIAEAMELIGKPRSPSDADRDQMHDLLEDLVERGVPEPFRYEDEPAQTRQPDYEIWPQKLAHNSWRLLQEHGVIGPLLNNADYPANQSGGLTIMAMLADVMAGETRARVTDRGLAYATIANVTKYEPFEPADAMDVAQVIPLTFKTLALEYVGLDRLIAFRKKEEGPRGHEYRALRHRYLDRLENYVTKAAKYALGSEDREEEDRIFSLEMEDDLKDLQDELGVANLDGLLSKDTLTLVLAIGGLAGGALAGAHVPIPEALTLAGAPATVGGMFGVASKFGAKRREVMRKHPMAYLYEVTR